MSSLISYFFGKSEPNSNSTPSANIVDDWVVVTAPAVVETSKSTTQKVDGFDFVTLEASSVSELDEATRERFRLFLQEQQQNLTREKDLVTTVVDVRNIDVMEQPTITPNVEDNNNNVDANATLAARVIQVLVGEIDSNKNNSVFLSKSAFKKMEKQKEMNNRRIVLPQKVNKLLLQGPTHARETKGHTRRAKKNRH